MTWSRRGLGLGPILFTFNIAAVLITWRKTFSGDVCMFRTKEDFILTGRRHDAVYEEFPLTDSEFADDTAALFTSRTSVEDDVPLLHNHFARFGMEVHKGIVPTKKTSKTEILFCVKPLHMYNDPETYDGANLSNVELGNGDYIPIVAFFVNLGRVLSRDCSDTLDVRNIIEKAAFGSLRDDVFK